jgi:hypothetical protein
VRHSETQLGPCSARWNKEGSNRLPDGRDCRGYPWPLFTQIPADAPGVHCQLRRDTLWALTAFLGPGPLFTRWPTLRVAVTALLFSFAIELSQLYQSPWAAGVRRTKVESLILGRGFLWSYLLCYGVGVALGSILDRLLEGPFTGRHRTGSVT